MLEIGQLVDNKYRVLDIVGKGGMSVVYLARNERANKSWAIKEVRKVGEENLEVKKNSLIAETEMLKNLSHPNLPTIVDVIETKDTYLVVMDYIEGNDLGKVLNEFGAQSQEKVIEWGKQLCDVLGYLHTREKPIIYRDLKPANVMLKPDGNIMLIDFGTAREVKVADAADTISLGTRGYAAPEQFGANAKTDARTDIYCLGATMYHLVTNHNPATEPYVMSPIRERNPALSAGLEDIILKCTQPKPQDRYQSCAELLYALENYETIDITYRKKQKRKLSMFIGSLVMMLISIVVSVFGFVSAENKKSENIGTYIAEAENESNSKQQREDAYLQAIALNPTELSFYDGLLNLFLAYDDNGTPEQNQLSIKEVTILDSLMLTKNNVQPLIELQKSDKQAYEEFCQDTGFSCWYYYNSSTRSEVEASEWFKRYLDSIGNTDTEEAKFVSIYYSIGECRNEQTARQVELIEKYEKLWELLNNLNTLCSQATDEEGRVLGYKEIVNEINNNCEMLAELESISESSVISMIEEVKSEIMELYSGSGKSIRQLIEEQFVSVNVEGQQVGVEDYFDNLINKVESNYRNE